MGAIEKLLKLIKILLRIFGVYFKFEYKVRTIYITI